MVRDKARTLVNARVVSKYPYRGPAGERAGLGDTPLVLATRRKYGPLMKLLIEEVNSGEGEGEGSA